jgi:hypothetical protein
MVGALGRYVIHAFIAFLVVGCAQSETRSVVNPADIPPSRYKKIVLFVENIEGRERAGAEQVVSKTFQDAGINTVPSSEVFGGTKLDANTQGQRIRKAGFDAALFLNVAQKGAFEERVENAYFDGEMIQITMGFVTVGHNVTDFYLIKPDGSVYYPMLVLKAQSELQDVKSGKQVWAAETIASGHAQTTNMTMVFTQAAKQIVDKMRADQAI